MRERADRNGTELLFSVAVVLACLFAVGATFRLASGVSSAERQMPVTDSSGAVEVRALARQATIRVAARSCREVTQGSGFVVGEWLLTNEHVVRGVDEIKADQPIAPVFLPVAGRSEAIDLAAAPAPSAVSLELADTPAAVDDRVLVAGHAGGGAIETQEATVVNRVRGTAFGLDADVLLIDVPTRGGYSGGPVLDRDGHVVAMLSGFDRSTELSIAVTAEDIADFLDQLPEPGNELELEPCGNR